MRTNLILFCCTLALNSIAQVWAPPEAMWHYVFSSGFGAEGFVRITMGNDTVVQGRACKVLHKRSIGHDFANDVDFDWNIGDEVTCDSLGLVHIFDPVIEVFDTLFNLNAAPGDSWDLAKQPYAAVCDTNSHATVLDTGTRVIEGTLLKWIHVAVQFSPLEFSNLSFMDTIFERIGPVGSFLLPHDPCNAALDGQQGGPFRCYQDDLFSYQRDVSISCEAPLFIPVNTNSASLGVFPNPGADHFSLMFPTSWSGSLSVYDPVGRLILTNERLAPLITVDATTWRAGIYLVLVRDHQGRVQTLKWVKE